MDTLPLGSPERRLRPEVVAFANYKAGPRPPWHREVSPKGGPARRLACALAKRLRRRRARAVHPANLIHRPWPRTSPAYPNATSARRRVSRLPAPRVSGCPGRRQRLLLAVRKSTIIRTVDGQGGGLSWRNRISSWYRQPP
jgi:hypothetical protein